jgi:calcineurin-like phosphoesterase family protein
MRRFWTADLHLGHSNIIEYTDRPFRDCDHMNERLIGGINQRCRPEDTLVHVGDFTMRCSKSHFKDWRDKINCHTVFIEGNHDPNNRVKTVCSSMFCKISHFTVFVSHVPYFYEDWFDESLIAYIENTCDFAICGHVHEKWKLSWEGEIPTINVGCDQWRYMPVSDDEIASYYNKEKR